MKDYSKIGLQYAKDVVSNKILVCDFVKQACQRHIDDLAKQSTIGFPYKFDTKQANRVCEFIELFKVFEGPLAGKNIELMNWQCFFLNLYIWLAL